MVFGFISVSGRYRLLGGMHGVNGKPNEAQHRE